MGRGGSYAVVSAAMADAAMLIKFLRLDAGVHEKFLDETLEKFDEAGIGCMEDLLLFPSEADLESCGVKKAAARRISMRLARETPASDKPEPPATKVGPRQAVAAADVTTPQARRSTSTVLNSPPAPRQRALSMAFESAADEALAPPALGASEAASRLQAIARGRIVRSSLLAPLELGCSVVPSWFFGVEPRVAAAVRLQAWARGMYYRQHARGLCLARYPSPYLALVLALREARAADAGIEALEEQFAYLDDPNYDDLAPLEFFCRSASYFERSIKLLDDAQARAHAAACTLRSAVDALKAAAETVWGTIYGDCFWRETPDDSPCRRPGWRPEWATGQTVDYAIHRLVLREVEAGDKAVGRCTSGEAYGWASVLRATRDAWTAASLRLQALARGQYTRRRLSALHTLHAFGTLYQRPPGIYLHRVIGGGYGRLNGGTSFDFIYCKCKTNIPSAALALSDYINTPPAAAEVLPGGISGDGLREQHAKATSPPTAAHRDRGTPAGPRGHGKDTSRLQHDRRAVHFASNAGGNERHYVARLKAAAARAEELTDRGKVTVIGDMIYRSGSAACDVAAEIMLQIDRSDPYNEDSLDDDAWRMPDDDLSEWHRASAEDSDEAMSDDDY